MKIELIRAKRTSRDNRIAFHLFVNDVPIQAFESKESALKLAVNWINTPKGEWIDNYSKGTRAEKLLSFTQLYIIIENMGDVREVLFNEWKSRYNDDNVDNNTLREIFNSMDIEDMVK